EDAQDLDAYTLAKSYFDLKEYDRAAYFLRGCKSQKAYFLFMYSRYLSGEKRKDDETVDSLGPLEKGQVKNEALRELRVELSKKHKARELDGFGLYLYGVVLRKLDLVKEALDVFVEATHVLPLHWGTWLELCNLITDKEMEDKATKKLEKSEKSEKSEKPDRYEKIKKCPVCIRKLPAVWDKKLCQQCTDQIVRAEQPSLVDELRSMMKREIQASLASLPAPGPSSPKKRKLQSAPSKCEPSEERVHLHLLFRYQRAIHQKISQWNLHIGQECGLRGRRLIDISV
ncbi:uncharacterized protein ACNLHF_005382, partial [Anomaloglossus baeobatrachus]|uniref:uncharacterized protein LOC142280527 n=1 Tax=Anomaloglossus baeobatrachus TaxID=238106 RepID=UPI003F5001DA